MLMESQTDKKPCPAYGAPIFREPSGDDVWVPGSVVSWLGFALESYIGFSSWPRNRYNTLALSGVW
jgi:hypothetical protein